MSAPETISLIQIPETAIQELTWVESMDWSDGVDLTKLINWINSVVEQYRPPDQDLRSSPHFTPRSFRHYQTMGCIDSPWRVGKNARYGFRHYLQALVIRKLLWQRVPSGQIVDLMKDKSNQEYKSLLFQGILIATNPLPAEAEPRRATPQHWVRMQLIQGVELHLCGDRSGPFNESDIRRILETAEQTLRSHGNRR